MTAELARLYSLIQVNIMWHTGISQSKCSSLSVANRHLLIRQFTIINWLKLSKLECSNLALFLNLVRIVKVCFLLC